MKKTISIILSILLVIPISVQASAISSSSEYEMSGLELSIKRLNANIRGKSDVEFAEEILSDMGMSDRMINCLSDDKKEEFAQSNRIIKNEEYIQIDEDGNENYLTKMQYENINSNYNNDVSVCSQGDNWYVPDDGKNSSFARQLWIFETKNAPSGTFGIIGTYEWKSMPFWRGLDVITVSAEEMTFDRSSFSTTVIYDSVYTNAGITVEEQIMNYYDMNNTSDLHLQGIENGIYFKYNLPNDGISIGSSLPSSYCKNLGFITTASGEISHPELQTRFNVYFNYFHQKIGLGSVGVSVSANGASFSVSPVFAYTRHQIMTPSPILYTP